MDAPRAGAARTAGQVGHLLRAWRERRRLSQLALACDADISARHLSFVETGRAQPSRDMVLKLAAQLDVPLRDRNRLLLAAGYAPAYPEREYGDPALESARAAIEAVLAGHEPYPALTVDRHWHLLAANRMVPPLLAGVQPSLLAPPVNVLRLSLHPAGLSPRIVNWHEWRAHALERLRRQADAAGDAALEALHTELRNYPAPAHAIRGTAEDSPHTPGGLVVPFTLRTEAGVLAFISTTTVFGTPTDVLLSELAIETFLPADARTADALRALAAGIVAGQESNR